MKSTYFANTSLWLGAIALLFGSAILARATAPPVKNTQAAGNSREAAQLMRDIRADAGQVRSAATHLNNLAATPEARWIEYDRQWNEIKPPVEDMQFKLARLDAIETSVSAAQRKDIDQSRLLVREIRNQTHELRTLLDRPGVKTDNPMFRTYADSIRSEAGRLGATVG